MFENILTSAQMKLAEQLFPAIKGFFLAGGTAIALQIGHRRSIDFDLASKNPIAPFDLDRNLIEKEIRIQETFTATSDEYSILVANVRLTFFNFPFEVQHLVKWERCDITLPNILDLSAMKAYALGRRNQWKDYVDLYFLLKFHVKMDEIISKASDLFSKHFNAKLFREQLCYFDDLDDSETIEYIDYEPKNADIKKYLESIATNI